MQINLTIKPPARFVLKISGHILNPDNVKLVREYAEQLIEFRNYGLSLAVVVGGGTYARKYIDSARGLGANESICDLIGINVTRLNAMLLISALNEYAYPEPPRSYEEFLRAWTSGKIVVCGGFQPGQSTATVAALIAEALNADVLALASRVDAVYDKDPRIYRNAKRLRKITTHKLKEILARQSVEAGKYELLDALAISIVERSKIPVVVFNGNDINCLKNLVVKGEVCGTLIEIL